MKAAFKRLGVKNTLPTENRWICTIELAKKRTDLVPASVKKKLDSLLTRFGLEARDPKAKHDAYIDCIKTAELYMKLNVKKD